MTPKTFSCNAKFDNLPHPEFKVIISWLNMLQLIINQSYSFERFSIFSDTFLASLCNGQNGKSKEISIGGGDKEGSGK